MRSGFNEVNSNPNVRLRRVGVNPNPQPQVQVVGLPPLGSGPGVRTPGSTPTPNPPLRGMLRLCQAASEGVSRSLEL